MYIGWLAWGRQWQPTIELVLFLELKTATSMHDSRWISPSPHLSSKCLKVIAYERELC